MADVEIIDLPESDTTCSQCYAEFLDLEDLEIHMKQMHDTGPTLIQCQFCGHCFSDLEIYAAHLRNDHLINMKCCKYCTRIFDDIHSFKRHETKHYLYINKSQYSCSVCKTIFNNIAELEDHEYKNHKESGDGVFLRECLPFLSVILNINARRLLQSLDEDVVYICVMCEEATTVLRDYIEHLKIKNCQSFACDTCCSVYTQKVKLVKHFSTHPQCCHKFRRELKPCTECFKLFDVSIWKDHCKNCKVLKCKQCNTVFSSVYHLSNHQSKLHPNIVTLLTCKFCNKDCAGDAALMKHIDRAHRHEFHLYKYLCVYCKSIFKHPNKLFVHFYTHHKELEPYTCKICDKKFRIRKRFTLHIKMDHNSIGYVEFEENYHVSFTDKKSANPFVPQQLLGNNNISLESLYLPTVVRSEDSHSQQDVHDNVKEKGAKSSIKNITQVNVDDCKEQANKNSINMGTTEEDVRKKDETKNQEAKKKGKLRKRPKKLESYIVSDTGSSDDEPLVELKRKQEKQHKLKLRNATWNRNKKRKLNDDKKRFICDICDKYCYTYQNYNNHISMHYHNIKTKCVKCSQVFKTKEDLDKHYSVKHSKSQLTETLKNILEKRKGKKTIEASNKVKFMRTIKRVPSIDNGKSATLKINNGLSVQKFIESFTPEAEMKSSTLSETNTLRNGQVTITRVNCVISEPKIKMTKCNLEHIQLSSKLARPVRFKPIYKERVTATFKLIPSADIEQADESHTDYEECGTGAEDIPEVAEEIMLEVPDETAKQFEGSQNIIISNAPTSFVIPKLPENCKEMHIAHLQAEAPYYRIIKLEEGSKEVENSIKEENPQRLIQKGVILSDGTKLVSVNPLAHLLGNKPVDEILATSKNKYYKPKALDIESAISKALLQLKTPGKPPKKKKTAKNVK